LPLRLPVTSWHFSLFLTLCMCDSVCIYAIVLIEALAAKTQWMLSGSWLAWYRGSTAYYLAIWIFIIMLLTSLVAGPTTSWLQDGQLGIPSAVKQSTWLTIFISPQKVLLAPSGLLRRDRVCVFLRSWLLRLLELCLTNFPTYLQKVLCHSCSQSFWWQMFCCSWTTYLEQFTCQSARQRSQLHRIQKTTENIHVSDGLRHIVTFLIIAPYKYSYLLTYLLPMLIARWSHDAANRHTTAPTATPGLQPIAHSR